MTKPVVIVTGSSGFIGSAAIARLEEKYEILGFDRPGLPHPPPPAHAIDADLTQRDSILAALDQSRRLFGDRIASVIHLAAYYDFSGEPSFKYEEVTVRGTERLLDSLKPFQVEQFIFSSTMLVHAPTRPGEPIDEDSPLAPSWAYPKSKVATEKLIHEQRGDIPTVMLRIAGVYNDRCHSIPLANQIQRIDERQLTSSLFPGESEHGQSFLHIDDLVDALALLVDKRRKLPQETVLLLGEPDAVPYAEVQRILGQAIHGENWPTLEIPKFAAKAGAWVQDKFSGDDEQFIKPWMIDRADDHYELDIRRAKALGWSPRHSLRETLPKMAAALKADRPGWYRDHDLTPSDGGDSEAT